MSLISITASSILTFRVNSFSPKIYFQKDSVEGPYPFYQYLHQKYFQKNLRVQPHLDSKRCAIVKKIIIKYWYFFFKEGAQRPLLEYKFSIDTCTSKPVFYRKPQYGPYESKIIMSQIEVLLQNKCIEECGGPWGRIIILAAKTRHEHITNIDYFKWRMCVSYWNLNEITKPFEFPIPLCNNTISSVGAGSVTILSSALAPTRVTIKFKCKK